MSIDSSVTDRLRAAGLDAAAIADWTTAAQAGTANYAGDCGRYSRFWKQSNDLLARLPAKPRRSPAEAAAAQAILTAAREHRERFLGAHAEAVYDHLTGNCSRFVRV